MFDEEERDLLEFGKKINSIPKPDCIDEYIKKGIELGHRRKKVIKMKRFLNIAAVIILFVTSIRISPVFAKCISVIPGMEYIVKLINYDRGLKDVVDNNFVQRINMSKEHEDIIFTMKDMIIDDSKVIIFYSIENKGEHRFISIEKMDFKNEKGEKLKCSIGFDKFGYKDMSIEKKLEGTIDINFTDEKTIPNKIFISLKLKDSYFGNTVSDKDRILNSTWNFEIPVDKKKFESMRRVYTLNKRIEVEGQGILFKDVIITPTRVAVKIEYDKNNTKKIIGFDDISIVDENGETRGIIKNGVNAKIIDENNLILYFQSNYFDNPNELYITGSCIEALDKDKLNAIVDIDKKKLIEVSNNKLKLISIKKLDNGGSRLEFELETDKIVDDNYYYSISSNKFKDSNGNVYYFTSVENSQCTDNKLSLYFDINNNTKFKSPINLTIDNYPTRIKESFKIKIK